MLGKGQGKKKKEFINIQRINTVSAAGKKEKKEFSQLAFCSWYWQQQYQTGVDFDEHNSLLIPIFEASVGCSRCCWTHQASWSTQTSACPRWRGRTWMSCSLSLLRLGNTGTSSQPMKWWNRSPLQVHNSFPSVFPISTLTITMTEISSFSGWGWWRKGKIWPVKGDPPAKTQVGWKTPNVSRNVYMQALHYGSINICTAEVLFFVFCFKFDFRM